MELTAEDAEAAFPAPEEEDIDKQRRRPRAPETADAAVVAALLHILGVGDYLRKHLYAPQQLCLSGYRDKKSRRRREMRRRTPAPRSCDWRHRVDVLYSF